MSALKPSEVLAKAADLIEPPERWFRTDYTRWSVSLDEARQMPHECFCALGAIAAADEGCTDFWEAEGTGAARYLCLDLGLKAGDEIATWNDEPDRTQAEVVAALRKASELAKAKGR